MWHCGKCELDTDNGLEVLDMGDWMMKQGGKQVVVDMDLRRCGGRIMRRF